MRPRTFILLLLVLVVFACAAILVVALVTDTGSALLGNILPGQAQQQPEVTVVQDTPVPTPTATPALQPVVVAKVQLPVGEILSPEVLDIEFRPITNVALVGGYTFTSTEQVTGRILRTDVARGQEILQPMLALNPTDVAAFGSDLALYVPSNQVAVAFPIDQFSGAALAMRPGDRVDVIMTLRSVPVDPDFQSGLRNYLELVDVDALLEGDDFLFPKILYGRLEFIDAINQVGVIMPNEFKDPTVNPDWLPGNPVPKRVTQLTIQQANVLYVGQWVDPRRLEQEQEAARLAADATAQAVSAGGEPVAIVTPTPIPSRLEANPGMVILSMSVQDALVLKYARERNVDIDLVLRSPGDQTVFVTTSVSLLQMVDQGIIGLPEPPPEIDLFDPVIEPTRALPDSGGGGG
ncbi:MAG TPA: RcpC/CpaB family pilus assembly protein [Chloroflexota bacterium]|nr:RcpC/CpaB family pilus assembly protein [Chloroflexota bacterium]HUM68100.1 RcpC/CpaB family pilus assembly protein [Chloroflexota bacterium]